MCAFTKPVLIVAPPTLHRQGLLTTLQDTWPGLSLELQPDASALPRLLYQQAYAVVVLDCAVLVEPAVTFLARLHTIRSAQPVLLLTGTRLPPDLRHYLTEVAVTHSWLPHHAAPATLAALFHAYFPTAEDGASVPAHPQRLTMPPTPFSRRELEVLRLVVNDCCNQEIADQLCLSVRTIESHRRALLQKAGAKTLVGLAVRAVREGWVVA